MEEERKADKLRSNGKIPQEVEIKRGHPGIVPKNVEQSSPESSPRPNGGLGAAAFLLVAAACVIGMIIVYFVMGGG